MRVLNHLLLIFLLGTACAATAQKEEGNDDTTGRNTRYEIGAHLGNLLPNQIEGVTEILGLGGVRAGTRIGNMSFAEAGLIMGNGSGVQWKNAHVDARIDIPVENLVALAYVGIDAYYYKVGSNSAKAAFGGHAGGGIHALITGSIWVRGDMKFSFSPGTSLYVGFGIEFRFPDGGAGGGGPG